MALNDVKRRLRKYQRETRKTQAVTPEVAAIIREGRYYDELTPQEQNEVIAYYGTDRDTFETVYGGLFNNCSLHFQVKPKKPAPRTKAEREKINEEIQTIWDEVAVEYNSPEARAKREAEYQELQRIGRLRATCAGDMDEKYPLPWAEKDREERERWERFNQERKVMTA